MDSWLTVDMIELLQSGLILTLFVSLVTTIGAMIVGIAAGTASILGSRLVQRFARIFIEIHRNIPALVLVIFWAFAIPNVFPQQVRQQLFFNNSFWDSISNGTGISLPYYFLAGTFGLLLNTSGYLAEIFRSGVNTVPAEQFESARTLGANRRVVFWQIMLPSGLTAAFPAISTRLIHNFKNCALLSLVAVPVFFHGIQTAISKTFRATEFLLLATVVYLVLTALIATLLRYVETRLPMGESRV